jgi:hypothetical protein
MRLNKRLDFAERIGATSGSKSRSLGKALGPGVRKREALRGLVLLSGVVVTRTLAFAVGSGAKARILKADDDDDDDDRDRDDRNRDHGDRDDYDQDRDRDGFDHRRRQDRRS